MATPAPIQKRIDNIKEIFGDHPNCYLVAVLLATAFGGTIYYNSFHCVAQIGNGFYDRTGEVDPDELVDGNYLPMYEYGIQTEALLVKSLIDKHRDFEFNIVPL